MSLFLAIVGILAILIGALEMRRRHRKALARTRRRHLLSSGAGGFALDRESSGPRARARGSKSSPFLLGLVLLILGLWLVVSFLGSSEDSGSSQEAEMVTKSESEQMATLVGQLTAPSQEPGIIAQSATAATAGAAETLSATSNAEERNQDFLAANDAVLAQLVLSMKPDSSHIDQIGLLLMKETGPANRQEGPGGQLNSTAARPATAGEVSPPIQVPRPNATTSPPPTSTPPASAAGTPEGTGSRSTIVAAASASSSRDNLPSETSTRLDGRQYTIHLGSFSERGNAEKYQARLTSAGESALIVESVVDGRRWYRVMSGRFNSKDSAEAYGRDLRRRGLTVETGRYLVKAVEEN